MIRICPKVLIFYICCPLSMAMDGSEEPASCFNFINKIVRFFNQDVEYNSVSNILEIQAHDYCNSSNIFELLPNEILLEISSYLSPQDITRLSHTCKGIRNFLVTDKAFIVEYCNILKIRISIAENDLIKAMLGEHYYLQGIKTKEMTLLTKACPLGSRRAKNYLEKLSSLKKKHHKALSERSLLKGDYSHFSTGLKKERWDY